ncbi:hypothetical protein GGX14DRAFT_572544 [Mycena pura]|uniref:F-box domain-containing protein n=1 Tax=Mycena pura TaxID=153505 RepID=A0AAD6V4R3_9AGAR|nr:hypothetical protein GGX14DRAFT_572544 [Mycena pura]
MSDVSGWDISSARQNLTPNEVDRASIQHAIAEAQLRLTTPQESEANAQELRSRIAMLSSMLAPIRRLPPRILASKFIHPVLHTSVSRGSLPAHFGGRGLGPITAVSFHWRTTALSTPEFWTLFTITLPGNDNVARLLELYLERSKPCARWTTLHLSVDSSQLSLFSPVRGQLQSLKNFDLHVSRIGTREELMEVVVADAFELAPKLSHLKLFMADNVVPALPLNQIRTLTVSSWNALLFASECPNLIILAIPHDFREATPPPRVTVAALNILTKISQHTISNSSKLLRSLDTCMVPLLHPAICVSSAHTVSPSPHPNRPLSRPLSSSSPPLLPALTNLSLTGSYLFSNAALLEMLESRVNFQQSIQRVRLQLTHRHFSEVELDRARALQRDMVLFSLNCLDADKQYTKII